MSDALHRLDPAATALLVIDLQERLLPHVLEPERVVRATRLLLRAARVLDLPVIATTQYEKGLGPLVKPVDELVPATAVRLDKTAFSCFDDPRFAAALGERARAARTLLVAGIESHICVLGTVLGARRRGLAVEVAVDAVSARGAVDHATALARFGRAGALETTAETAMYELLGGSGTPAFQAMLPYLKVGA